MRDENNVYSMLPEGLLDGNESATVKSVYRVLAENRDRSMTTREIAEAIGKQEGETRPNIRRAISVLLECDGVPIVSGVDGYRFATDDATLRTYIDDLGARIRGIQARIAAVQRIIEARAHKRPVHGDYAVVKIDEWLTEKKNARQNVSAKELLDIALLYGVACGVVLARWAKINPQVISESAAQYAKEEILL